MQRATTRIFIAFLAASCLVAAENPPVTNPLDGVTPHALKPGTPEGSYILNGFESINHYSGHLNFALPLIHIGGRGEVSHSPILAISPLPWTIDVGYFSDVNSGNTPGFMKRTFMTLANADGWYPYHAGYGPGMIILKRSVGNLGECGTGSPRSQIYESGFSYVVFLMPDGTEVNLYDSIGLGASLSSSDCSVSGDNRGKVFKQRGGAGMTFVSDTDIVDLTNSNSYPDATTPNPAVYGTLYFSDGGRAAVSNGSITQKWDRHGNKIQFGYINREIALITDPLGRTYAFDYDYVDVAPYGTVDRIRYRPNNTTSEQIIRIKYGMYNSNRRSDIPFPPGGLFAQASNPILNPQDRRPIAVYLPNSRTYSFTYSEYGDLASVTLPTGGKIEYDHKEGVNCGTALGSGCYPSGQILDKLDAVPFIWNQAAGDIPPSRPSWAPVVYRRLTERREYSDGAALSKTTTISRPERASTPSQTSIAPIRYSGISIVRDAFVSVVESSPTVTNSITTKHYFFGGNDASVWTGTSDESAGAVIELRNNILFPSFRYPDPFTGKEFTTEVPNFRKTEFTHSLVNATNGVVETCQENTTLLDGGTKTTGMVSAFDQRGNRTDLYEYDFGSAPIITTATDPPPNYVVRTCPTVNATTNGGYLRHAVTVYKDDYAPTPTHQPSVVSSNTVYERQAGLDVLTSQSIFGYDTTVVGATAPVNWDPPPAQKPTWQLDFSNSLAERSLLRYW